MRRDADGHGHLGSVDERSTSSGSLGHDEGAFEIGLGRTTQNSSPPKRAATSYSRVALCSAIATDFRALSPRGGPASC
jgi:hypothetical protein